MAIEFLGNKYTKWYNAIISKALTREPRGYNEKHHIIPRSLNGSDNSDNIVKLTAREHFVCHLLLVKMTTGYHNNLMKFAVGKFIQTAPGQKRIFTSWEYKKIRETISEARTGKKHSESTRKKMSDKRKGQIPWNKGITGIVHSEESNRKRSLTIKGRKMSADFCKKVSEGKKGHKSGMTGKQHNEETKIKMSKSMRGPKGSQTRIDECPHCFLKTVTYRHVKFCKIKT